MKTTRIRIPVLLALSLVAVGGPGPLARASACPNSAVNLAILLGPHMLTVGPDLCDGGVEYGFDPQTVNTGERIHILGRIKNTGTVTVSANTFHVGFYASADTMIDPAVDYQIGDLGGTFPKAIEPGNFYRFDLLRVVNVPPGKYYVGWIIDCTNAVAETNESNNTVCITIARLIVHAAEVTVPIVVGKDEKSAVGVIKAAALLVGVTTRSCSNTVAAGNVISQSPAAGTKVMSGSVVNLVVSTGPSEAQTEAATNVTCSSATLNGKVIADGGAACQYRFRYKKVWDGLTYTEIPWIGSKRTGETFSQAITGLSPGTQYRFAAQVKNSTCESDWGTELRFTTPTSPTVAAEAATHITAYGATLNGKLVDDGGQTCQFQLRYKPLGGSYTESKWQTLRLGPNGAFIMEILELTPSRTYIFSFRARNDSCEGAWSNELGFKTLTVVKPTAAMVDVTNVLDRSATFTGQIIDDGNEPCQHRFRYNWGTLPNTPVPSARASSGASGLKATGEPRIPGMIMLEQATYTQTSWTGAKQKGETFSEDITPLGPNTRYAVRVQARNSAGEGPWSTAVSITTLAIPEITSIRGTHFWQTQHAYFVDGVPLTEKITVGINWHGATPGKIEWKTPNRVYETPAGTVSLFNMATESLTFNMATDFGVGGKLMVRAVPSSDAQGARESASVTANFTVTPPPPGIPADKLSLIPQPDPRFLVYAGKFTAVLLHEIVKSGVIPENFLFYHDVFGFDWQMPIEVVVIDGTADYLPRPYRQMVFYVAGVEIADDAVFRLTCSYRDGRWQPDGYLQTAISASGGSGKVGIPLVDLFYIEIVLRVTMNAILDVVGWPLAQRPDLAGQFCLDVVGEGHAGMGLFGGLVSSGLYVGIGYGICLDYQKASRLEQFCSRIIIGVESCGFWRCRKENLLDESWCSDLQGVDILDILEDTFSRPAASDFGLAGRIMDGADFEPMNRDYIGPDYARWLPPDPADNGGGGNLTILSAADGAPGESGEEQVLQTNVFPMSKPSIAADADQLFLAWAYDDPNRSSANRTKVVFSKSDGGTWTAPEAIHDNGAVDFSPQLAVLANGQVLCAWEKLNRILPDDVDVTDMASAMEIAVASYNDATGLWNTKVLTADSHMDRTPRIAAGDHDKAMVVWVHNDGDDVFGEDPNALNTSSYSLWDGSEWSAPTTAATGIGCMLKTALAYNGTQGVYVYSMDGDWSMVTDKDQELYALVYDGTRWLPPRRLTNNEVLDANPQVAYDGTNPLLVWYHQSQIVSCRNLDPNNYRLVLEAGNSVGVMDFRMAKASGGRISLVWTGVSAQTNGVDIFAALYDPSFDLWSNPLALTADSDEENALAVTFAGPDELALIYNKNRLRADEDGLPEAYQTDLCVLRHRLGRDLAISPEDVSISKPDPNNGGRVEISAVVHNLGDAPEVDVPVRFYYGKLGEEGELIGDPQIIQGPTLAAGQATVSITWTIPQADSVTELCVVVLDKGDPQTGQPDRDTNNNVACILVTVPDLTVQSVSVEKIDYKMRRVVATIANLEPVSARNVGVTIRSDSPEGEELTHFTIPTIAAKSAEEISWDWDIMSLTFDHPEVVVCVVVDASHTVTEADENNNTGFALVHVSKTGDITDDGSVDETDLFYFMRHWLDTSESPYWLPTCDLDQNGRIDGVDLAILATNWRWEAVWHTE